MLYQIPNGSLPLQKTKYIESKIVTLQPYSTSKHAVTFYFPGEGKFEHYPSNISENGIVVAKSPMQSLEVGKKRVVKSVETFKDLMVTAPTPQDKKERIIDLFKNDFKKVLDPKFGFEFNDIVPFLHDDFDFFMSIYDLIEGSKGFIDLRPHIFTHKKRIIEEMAK